MKKTIDPEKHEITFEQSLATFRIQLEGEDTQDSFQGTFQVKTILSPLDLIDADRMYRELVGATRPELASETIHNIAYSLAQLKHRIVKEPPFWQNERLSGSHVDKNVITAVFELAFEAETRFKRNLKQQGEQSKQTVAKRIKTGEINVSKKNPKLDTENDQNES